MAAPPELAGAVLDAPSRRRPPPRRRPPSPLRSSVGKTGTGIAQVLDLAFDQLAFYVKVVRTLPQGLRYRREITTLVSDITIGTGALVIGGGMFFVVTSIAFFTGTEVGLEGFTGLQQIGAQAFVGVISSLANTREITPLVAGVALAAQVGAGFTAQLGAMRISEEIDALEVMSVDSFTYLVTTRVWAALICMIPLYLAALFASFIATELVVTKFFGLSAGIYQHYFRLFLPPLDIVYSFVKAMVFAVAVTMIHCYYGYKATGGPAGVGVAAGRAIRISIIVVVLLNLLLSTVMFGGASSTARLVG
ncbi:MAG TPA: ABC transporter permease [Acidimicrobiales bacterium]|nr:ABC transporter permease [Acidimicrobiales bacterium]